MPTEVLEKTTAQILPKPEKQPQPEGQQQKPEQKPPPEDKRRRGDPGKRRRIPGKSKHNKPAKADGEPPSPAAPPKQADTIKFLAKQEVLRRIPITGPTLWHWSRTGRFPQPRFIGNRTVWIENEVEEWMRTRPTRNYKAAKGSVGHEQT